MNLHSIKRSDFYRPTVNDYDKLTKEFYTGGIDYELLAKDLKENLSGMKNFLFDYKKYTKTNTTITLDGNSFEIPENSNTKDVSNSLIFDIGKLNKRKNLLSNQFKYFFGINKHNGRVTYNLHFIYKDGEEIDFKKSENIITGDLTDYVINDEYIAIKLFTKNSDVYLNFLEAILGKNEPEQMKKHIIRYYKSFLHTSRDNANELDELYQNMPQFVLDSLSDETLWKNLEILSNARIDTIGTNENIAILNLLKGIKSYNWWYHKISTNVNIVQKLLENFSKKYLNDLIKIFSQIGLHNWTNKELEQAWMIELDYQSFDLSLNETIHYIGYAYYIKEKNKYETGTAIFLYENFGLKRKSEINNPVGLQNPFDVVKIPLEKNTLLYVPCFVAEYFTNKKIDEQLWDALNNVATVLHPELNSAITKGATILSRIFSGRKIKTVDELIEFLGKINQNVMAEDLEKVGIKALFRGTTKSAEGKIFSGNISSIENGASTSTDPIRAVIFGIESATLSGEKGVLQVYVPKDLKGLNLQSPNEYRFRLELEAVVNTSPENLSNFAVKEIPIEDARKLVEDVYGIRLDTRMHRGASDLWLEETRKLTPKDAFEFYKKLLKLQPAKKLYFVKPAVPNDNNNK